MADALFIIKAGKPYRTGDLKRSFEVVPTEDGFMIFTEQDYMVVTNEVWNRNGKQNPHLYWFDERVEMIADLIARMGGGYYVVK